MINHLSPTYLVQNALLQSQNPRPLVEEAQQLQNQQIQAQQAVPAKPLDPTHPQAGTQNNLEAQNQQAQAQAQAEVTRPVLEKIRRSEEATTSREVRARQKKSREGDGGESSDESGETGGSSAGKQAGSAGGSRFNSRLTQPQESSGGMIDSVA